MIRLIAEKELRETIVSTKYAVVFGVCSVLILLSFLIGARNYLLWERQYEAATQETLRRLEGLTDWFNVQQNRVFLPPQPLAALVSGVSNDIGRTTEIRGRGELTAEDSRFGDDPVFAVFRFLDLDFVIQVVLSLFAILFAYDSINGERERGTLKLSLANPVPRDTYILGKLAGSLLALGAPLIVPLLAGSLLLIVMGVPMSGDDWARLSLIVAAGYLYLGAFLALSVCVSALTRRSSSSFLILLVAWILAVLVVPRSAVLIAGRAVDVPSVDEVASQKSRYNAQLWDEDRKTMASFQPGAGAAPEKIMEEFNRFMQEIADRRDAKMKELAERLNEERDNRQRRRQDVALALARVSPAATFGLAVSTLAGTSLSLERHFRDAATAYQKEFARFIKEKTGMAPGGRMMAFRSVVEGEEKPKPINPAELPAFVYRPMALDDVLGGALLDFGLLALFTAIFFAGSYVAFLRYDVR